MNSLPLGLHEQIEVSTCASSINGTTGSNKIPRFRPTPILSVTSFRDRDQSRAGTDACACNRRWRHMMDLQWIRVHWEALPTVLHAGPYRLFFYSADRDEPPHVLVERDEGAAKFWLEPVRLEKSRSFLIEVMA